LGGLENQPVQELENYAVYKAEETTKAVNGCLKIAEEMREGATTTLITLHQQGEQITKTHSVAVEIDHDLSRVWLRLKSDFMVDDFNVSCLDFLT
jgi:synaptosomal-associated protein 25